MKISFVVPAFEFVGVECLSAFLKQHGHATHLAFDPLLLDNVFVQRPILGCMFSYRHRLLEEIERNRPDLIAFTVTGSDLPWARSVAEAIKSRMDVPIVFGGPQAWVCPEPIMEIEAVDYLVLGEGEEPLLAIVEAVESGSRDTIIPNVWSRAGGDVVQGPTQPPALELDDLPFPDKALFYDRLKHLYGYNMTTSRLCTRGCSYCYYNAIRRLAPARAHNRRRGVDCTLAELIERKPLYGKESVRFYDNDFAEDPKWLAAFAEGYAKEIGNPYHAQVNPSSLTVDVIEDLRRSSCFELQIGVQTINEKTKRAIGRSETLDEVRDAVEGTRRAGIRASVDLILGLPGENEEDALAAARFFNQHRPAMINVYWLGYLPHTDILDMAYRENMLTADDIEKINRGDTQITYFRDGLDLEANRHLLRAQMLLTMIPFMPRRVFEWVLKKWRHRLPVRLGPIVLWSLGGVLFRSSLDMHRRRFVAMHWEYGWKAFASAVRGMFTQAGKR